MRVDCRTTSVKGILGRREWFHHASYNRKKLKKMVARKKMLLTRMDTLRRGRLGQRGLE